MVKLNVVEKLSSYGLYGYYTKVASSKIEKWSDFYSYKVISQYKFTSRWVKCMTKNLLRGNQSKSGAICLSLEWKHTTSPHKKKSESRYICWKSDADALFDNQGVFYWEFMPEGTTINNSSSVKQPRNWEGDLTTKKTVKAIVLIHLQIQQTLRRNFSNNFFRCLFYPCQILQFLLNRLSTIFETSRFFLFFGCRKYHLGFFEFKFWNKQANEGARSDLYEEDPWV